MMKYIFQAGRILGFCLAGEVLQAVLPLPVPASIYGLVLLLIALLTGIVKIDQIKETAMFLIGIMPILFVPAAVGVKDLFPQIREMLLPILIALLPVTVIVMAVGGTVTQAVMRRKEARKNG